ncbi:hypothetical protein CPLU01_12336 [Colletotrichum plurivorum]|uniref:Protein-ribulosamine 3-kinase n=1 Tax=Colletotrichum plurivorum TaxID=2175906 RepID=A0A8H6K023_9PEZI|nr:hypothetical protein CPLU01_12336 [Colletotrichum plurivorum]
MEKQPTKRADQKGEDVQLDKGVLDKLPPDCKVLSVTSSAQNVSVATVKIVVQLKDGTMAEYFKKEASGAVGEDIMRGAFEGEQALYTFAPDRVPKPVAWGTYRNDPETHFYVCDFVEMIDKLPGARQWATAVSGLHLSSMGRSPTGQFGFQVPTHLANVPIDNTWNPSWESFWRQQMKSLFDQDDCVHGTDEELTALNIYSFTADLGICRNPRYKLGSSCIDEYLKQVPVAEPAEDFDCRNAVYAMKFHALLSVMYYKDKRFRNTLAEELKALIGKLDPST